MKSAGNIIHRVAILAITAAVAVGFSSCSITRRVPQGEYLVQRVTIEDDRQTPRHERVASDVLTKYVRQTPNKRFLGTNFYLWVYNLSNPDKDNWWNRFKRKIGEAPVLLDMSQTEKSEENIKIYLNSHGYFSSVVSAEVDTLSRRKRAYITYSVRQNEPYRIESLAYEFKDKFLEPVISPDTAATLIKVGEVFDITVLDAERERLASRLRQRGYYNVSVNNIEYIADTLGTGRGVKLKMVVKQNLVGYNERGDAVYDNNVVYRVRNINIVPDYDPDKARRTQNYFAKSDTLNYRGLNVIYDGHRPVLRAAALRPAVPIYPNYIYNSDQVSHAYRNLMAFGYFKSAKIAFTESAQNTEQTSYITFMGDGKSAERADSTQINYTREGYLDCNILCTPALKQSFRVDLEGSTTSSFYGLKAIVGYQNRNIFRGAELFEVTGTVGYEYMKAPDARKRNATEFGLSTSLTFPRFLPWRVSSLSAITSPRTKVELAYNYQNRPYYRRDLASAVLSYSWRNFGYSSFRVSPIDLNWVNVSYIDQTYFESLQNEYLKHSYESQLICALSASYHYNNAGRKTSISSSSLRFNFEIAGNLVDGLEHLFSQKASGEDYYRILGIRYSQYVRADLDASHKFAMGQKTAIAARLYGGFGLAYGNSVAIPFDRLFYAGGSNSMRGWAPRTLGPGSSALPTNSVYPTQMGDMKLEANVELRFPIWGILNGATFFDVGNVWYMGRDNVEYDANSVFHFRDFYKQLGFNTGIGLRLDIKFAILRLDWGIQLHNPNNPAGERWIHNFRWSNTALNFGVGYPF